MNSPLQLLVITLILLLDMSEVSGETSLCDEEIINRIQLFWGEDVPVDILNSEDAGGEGLTLLATAGLYPEQIRCIYSDIQDDMIRITVEPVQGEEQTMAVYVKEAEGVLSETESAIRSYVITNAHGVQAVYTCTTDGIPGRPTGLVRVLRNQIDEKTVIISKGVLALLGISLDIVYSDCLTD